MTESIEEKIKQLPDDWWQNASTIDQLGQLFQKFIICLFMCGIINNDYQRGVFTGFLYRIDGHLLWLTAGHVIEKIDNIIFSPNFKKPIFRWLDKFGRPEAEGIFANTNSWKRKSWTSENIDFGVIEFSPYESDALSKNPNIMIMDRIISKNFDNSSPEGYFLIGYPSHLNNFTVQPKGSKTLISVAPEIVCIPVEKYTPIGNTEFQSSQITDRFAGKLLDYPDYPEYEKHSIVGMSGGPLLSIERTSDARLKYRLAGIQAGWLPESGIIFAEKISKIELLIQNWIKTY